MALLQIAGPFRCVTGVSGINCYVATGVARIGGLHDKRTMLVFPVKRGVKRETRK